MREDKSTNKKRDTAEDPANKPVPASLSPAIVKTTKSVNDFKDYDNPTALREFATMLYESDMVPFSKIEDVISVMLWSRDMQFPLVTAMAHTMVVNDKIGIDSHAARALIQRAGIVAETLQDYIPIYEYSDPAGISYSHEQVFGNDDFHIFASPTAAAAVAKELENKMYKGKIPVVRSTQPVDRRTIIKFTRYYTTPERKIHVVEEFGVFDLSEADHAGLLSKSNWKNWERDCIYSRAYSRGARRIGDDYLLGAYTKLELADMSQEDDITLEHEEI